MPTRILSITFCVLMLMVGAAQADMNAFMDDLNITARGDLGGFKAQLGARFKLPNGQVEVVFGNVDSPADAAVCIWLGEQSRMPLDRVLNVYRSQKSKGWGAMAKSLGIKPGSSAFHALKNGAIPLGLHQNSGLSKGTAKGAGKEKKPKKNKNG